MTETLFGLEALTKQLSELETQLSGRVLKNAVKSALLPAEKAMKLAVPVGKKAHRTYKGNLVSPGFLKRSIRRRVYIDRRNGKVVGIIGVKAEAFYGVHFLDDGITVTKRRTRTKSGKRKKVQVKPYRITGKSWFVKSFIMNRSNIEQRLKEQLQKGIKKALQKR